MQPVADRIAQLAARDGGFVQSSQVRLQHGSGGEANLQLSLPSARLSAALAELARLAPTRAQSQSLQDITDEYGAARSKLSDAVAARQALLRALAKATTQGEIESLRSRLSLAGAAVTRARTAFASIARRGGNSTVEVNVLGDVHAGGGRSTLSTGLHDAGDVSRSRSLCSSSHSPYSYRWRCSWPSAPPAGAPGGGACASARCPDAGLTGSRAAASRIPPAPRSIERKTG